MHDSILRGFMNSFFSRLGSIMGIILGVLFGVLLIGIFSSSKEGDSEIKHIYTPQIVPNAKNERELLAESAPVLLKLNIHGMIGLDDLERHKVRELLVESREQTLKDNRVKGILLSIDSPGGTVFDADDIYRAIKAYKKQYQVPVYAYVDGLCASGGVYVACAADRIFASNASVIGSVGVLVPTAMNFSKLMDKIGVDSLAVSAGKGKDELNPFRPWKVDEAQNYQELVDDFYQTFVDIVTSNRPGVDKKKLIDEYGAHVFPAARAEEIGFIDGAGYSLSQALEELASAAGIQDEQYQVIQLKQDNWLQSIFKGQRDIPLLRGEVVHRLDLGSELDTRLMNRCLYLYRH